MVVSLFKDANPLGKNNQKSGFKFSFQWVNVDYDSYAFSTDPRLIPKKGFGKTNEIGNLFIDTHMENLTNQSKFDRLSRECKLLYHRICLVLEGKCLHYQQSY